MTAHKRTHHGTDGAEADPAHLRRRDDRCAAVRLWNWGTPYVQIIGFVIMLGTVVFAGGGKWNDVEAAILKTNELAAWRDGVNTDIAGMKQEIHDMHEWLKSDYVKK